MWVCPRISVPGSMLSWSRSFISAQFLCGDLRRVYTDLHTHKDFLPEASPAHMSTTQLLLGTSSRQFIFLTGPWVPFIKLLSVLSRRKLGARWILLDTAVQKKFNLSNMNFFSGYYLVGNMYSCHCLWSLPAITEIKT